MDRYYCALASHRRFLEVHGELFLLWNLSRLCILTGLHVPVVMFDDLGATSSRQDLQGSARYGAVDEGYTGACQNSCSGLATGRGIADPAERSRSSG